jgi:hypothetical protein
MSNEKSWIVSIGRKENGSDSRYITELPDSEGADYGTVAKSKDCLLLTFHQLKIAEKYFKDLRYEYMTPSNINTNKTINLIEKTKWGF